MKNDYNVSVSASGGGPVNRRKVGDSDEEDDISSQTYSQSATVTNSIEKKVINFEALKKKYLQNKNATAEEEEDDDDSSDYEDSKK